MSHRNGKYYEYRSSDSAPKDAQSMEKQGYVVIEAVFTAEEISALERDVDRVFREQAPSGRTLSRTLDEDEEFRYEMLNISAIAQQAGAHPRILEIIEPLIGQDCHIIANTAWRNEPKTEWALSGGGWHIVAAPPYTATQ